MSLGSKLTFVDLKLHFVEFFSSKVLKCYKASSSLHTFPLPQANTPALANSNYTQYSASTSTVTGTRLVGLDQHARRLEDDIEHNQGAR